MSSSSKRQQTMAKRAREQAVKEKRVRKQEKKLAAAERRANAALGLPEEGAIDGDESGEPNGQPVESNESSDAV